MSRSARVLFGASAAIVVLSGALVWFAPSKAPHLIIGSAPEGYTTEAFAEPGSNIDLGVLGPARIGGTVSGGEEVADVIVSAGGKSAHATIDRSVKPAVWWVYAAPPEPGTTSFDITSIGTDGSRRTQTVEYDFKMPSDNQTVLSPRVVNLDAANELEVLAYDPGSGVLEVTGSKPGVVKPDSILYAAPGGDVVPDGLLGRVAGMQGDENRMFVQTVDVPLDDAVLMGSVTVPIGGDSAAGISTVAAFDLAADIALPAGRETDSLLDVQGSCDGCTYPDPVLAGGAAESTEAETGEIGWVAESRFVGQAGIEVEIDIPWTWEWFSPDSAGSLQMDVVGSTQFAWRLEVDETAEGSDVDAVSLSGATHSPLVTGSPEIVELAGLEMVLQPRLQFRVEWDGDLVPGSSLGIAGSASGEGAIVTSASEPEGEGNVEADTQIRWSEGTAGRIRVAHTMAGTVAVGGASASALLSVEVDGTVGGSDSETAATASSTLDVAATYEVPLLTSIPLSPYALAEDQNEISIPATSVGDVGVISPPSRRIEAPPTPAIQSDPLSVMVVVDVSGSMDEDDGTGVRKLDGARSALRDFMATVDENARVGLRSYPSASSDCDAGDLLIPVGDNSDATINDAVAALAPHGQTPTAVALETAVTEDLPQSGPRTVVLISDGVSNCAGDPCEVARGLDGVLVDVTVNALGFQISDEGAAELECIAEATNGAFATVDDVDALRAQLQEYAGPLLTVTLDEPPPVKLNAAGVPAEAVVVEAQVKNVGGKPAADVFVSLEGLDGAVEVPDARRQIGMLAEGSSRKVQWVLVPEGSGDVELRAAASTADRDVEEATDTILLTVEGSSGKASEELAADSHVALLGDGFSSGEGAGGYLSASNWSKSDGRANRCHRSDETYGAPMLEDSEGVFGRRTIFACSSATSADILNASSSEVESPDGSAVVPSQLRQLQNASDPVDAVFVTSGWRDTLLGPTIRSCMAGGCEGLDGIGKTADDARDYLHLSLVPAYMGIDQVVNKSGELERRDGDIAPIIVPAYPLPMPIGIEAQQRCDVPPGIARAVNDEVMATNRSVEHATRLAAAQGVPVRYVGDTLYAFQGDPRLGVPSHTLCDGEPYLNGAEGGLSAFHPNAAGYAAITRRVLAAVESGSGSWDAYARESVRRADSGGEAPDGAPVAATTSLGGIMGSDGTGSVATTDRQPGSIGSGASVPAGGAVKRRAEGFEPGEVVVARLGSGGPVVGSAVADENGDAEVVANVPPWVLPHEADLVLAGGAAERGTRFTSDAISVTSASWWLIWLPAALSSAALGVGIVWLRRTRRGGHGSDTGDEGYESAVVGGIVPVGVSPQTSEGIGR